MADRVTPAIANAFWLEIGHDKVASFQEVSGLEDETDVTELVQSTKGGKPVYIKVQGANPLKTGKLTAKYAWFKDDPLRAWRDQVIQGETEKAKKDISIVLYTVDDKEVARFNFKNAWPSKYAMSQLSAKGGDPVAVTLTIEHEGMAVKGYNS